MKKLLITLLGISAALSASAIEAPKKIMTSYPSIIPENLTADGKSIMAVKTDNIITAYNSNLDVVATITLPKSEAIEYTRWYQSREYTPQSLTFRGILGPFGSLYADYWDEGGNHIFENFEQVDHALAQIKSQEGIDAEVGEFNGHTILITSYRYANYGQRYTNRFYMFDDGLWQVYQMDYDEDGWGPYGEWGEVNTYTDKTSNEYAIEDLYLVNKGIEYTWTCITQTLFNSDKEFEYIVPKYQKIEYSRETDTRREGGEKVVLTGASVMSENGSKLFDINIPAEYYKQAASENGFYVCMMDDKIYLVIDFRYYGEFSSGDESFSLFYELDGKGGIKAPKMVKSSMRVSPTTPRHGETVTIDLGEEAATATTVSLVAINGSTVCSLPVGVGQRNIELQTSGMAAGLYIVTANGREAAKIIIR